MTHALVLGVRLLEITRLSYLPLPHKVDSPLLFIENSLVHAVLLLLKFQNCKTRARKYHFRDLLHGKCRSLGTSKKQDNFNLVQYNHGIRTVFSKKQKNLNSAYHTFTNKSSNTYLIFRYSIFRYLFKYTCKQLCISGFRNALV